MEPRRSLRLAQKAEQNKAVSEIVAPGQLVNQTPREKIAIAQIVVNVHPPLWMLKPWDEPRHNKMQQQQNIIRTLSTFTFYLLGVLSGFIIMLIIIDRKNI